MSQTSIETDREATYSTPRWVKMAGIIIVVLVLLFIALQLISSGNHSPSRHMPSSDMGGDTPPSSVTEGHTPSIEHGGQ